MSRVAVTPIQESDLPEIGSFLSRNLNARIPSNTWIRSLQHPWCENRPNFGVQARVGNELVGVFCAIYSDQLVDGRIEKFCNPHSWCMQDAFRGESVSLPLHLIRQQGYHFTMLTPNPRVAEIFLRLGFRNMDDAIVVFPNLPAPGAVTGKRFACTERDEIARRLPESLRRDFDLHRQIPWLSFAAFGEDGDVCLVVYKRDRWKRLPCARIIHISDPNAFERHRRLLGHRLIGKGLAVSRVERRFLARDFRFAVRERRTQAKLVKSPTLADGQIRDLYTELVALDL